MIASILSSMAVSVQLQRRRAAQSRLLLNTVRETRSESLTLSLARHGEIPFMLFVTPSSSVCLKPCLMQFQPGECHYVPRS